MLEISEISRMVGGGAKAGLEGGTLGEDDETEPDKKTGGPAGSGVEVEVGDVGGLEKDKLSTFVCLLVAGGGVVLKNSMLGKVDSLLGWISW